MDLPNSVTSLMQPSRDSLVFSAEYNDEIDLSVLFQTTNTALPDFLMEMDSIMADIKKDRENINQYVMEITTQMDEQTGKFKSELKSKDEQMERICESHRQKEQSSQEKINAFRKKFQLMENVNLLSTVYFKEMMKRLAGAICDAEEFIKSMDCTNNAESNEAKNDGAEPETLVVSDASDGEVTSNESIFEHEKPIHRPTAAIDQPGPSNVDETVFVDSDDESVASEKENVAPPTNAPAIGPVEIGVHKTVKAVKSVTCRWCDEMVPKKLQTQHKWNVHKIPPKENKTTVKLERVLKRKNADNDQSDDEVSISSVTRPSLLPLRNRGQGIIKPKKAKKMVTSSPA